MTTPLLGFSEIASGVENQSTIHNTALRQIEARMVRVLSQAVTTPAVGAAEGDSYIIPSGATGVWSGRTDEIASWIGGAWSYYEPIEGVSVWVNDEDIHYTFDGTAWGDFSGGGGGGSGDVVGPVSAVNNRVAFFDGTSGKLIKDSGLTLAGTNTGDETTTTAGALINGATGKTTPVDADFVGVMDSAASNVLKKLSWANIKATLKTYFDGFYLVTTTKGDLSTYSTVPARLAVGANGYVLTADSAETTGIKWAPAAGGSSAQLVNQQVLGNYNVADSDNGKLITFTQSSVTVSLPQAGVSSQFLSGWWSDIQHTGAGTMTVTPTTSTIDGAASLTIRGGQGCRIVSDGTNYFTQKGGAGITPFVGGTMTGAVNEAPPVTLASAGTVNIGAAAANTVNITGTTTITAFDTIAAGALRCVIFAGALTWTHNATSMILPTGANISTAAGDCAFVESLGSGNWKCVGYQRADGTALSVSAGNQIMGTAGATGGNATVTGGTSTTSGNTGGTAVIVGGTNSVAGNGGNVSVKGGAGTATYQGGNVLIEGGAGNTGPGGSVTVKGGTGNSTNAFTTITTADGTSPAPTNIFTGAGTSFGPGGTLNIAPGGSNNAAGAPANIAGGAAHGTNQNGGKVGLKGGAATGTGAAGNVVLNDTGAALATTATGGFTCIPTCAGTPTGVPAVIPTGAAPMVWDSTNFRLYIYSGGAWKASAVFT